MGVILEKERYKNGRIYLENVSTKRTEIAKVTFLPKSVESVLYDIGTHRIPGTKNPNAGLLLQPPSRVRLDRDVHFRKSPDDFL